MDHATTPTQHLTADEQFFFDFAAWSYAPGSETPAQGRTRGAVALAAAEAAACAAGMSFAWEVDPYATSSDWNDGTEDEPHEVWDCAAYHPDEPGLPAATLGGIDLGAGVTPRESTYRRVVEAELAREALDNIAAIAATSGA